jgi:hypothetical protein
MGAFLVSSRDYLLRLSILRQVEGTGTGACHTKRQRTGDAASCPTVKREAKETSVDSERPHGADVIGPSNAHVSKRVSRSSSSTINIESH